MTDRDVFLTGCERLGVAVGVEQLAKIDAYVALLLKWQKAFNLVGPETVARVYERHVLDCAQLVPFIREDDVVLDIGAGAGLPSVVLAILTGACVYACELNGKKAQFLNEVRRTVLPEGRFHVLNKDVAFLVGDGLRFSVVTSRAFADLSDILTVGVPVLKEGGRFLLLKGATGVSEINNAKRNFLLTYDLRQSITNKDANIVELRVSGRTAEA